MNQLNKMFLRGEDFGWKVIRWKNQDRVFVFDDKGRIVTHVQFSDNVKSKIIRIILMKMGPREHIRKIEYEDGIYRINRVYMVYGAVDRERTPSPVAELRIIVYTKKPENYDIYKMDEYKREIVCLSNNSLSYKNTTFKITGFEKEKIDKDEVKGPFDRPFYYIAFFDRRGNIKPRGEIREYL